MYIVEATPRRDVNNLARLDQKTVVYLDSEVWFEPYIDTYDQRGQLWRTHIYGWLIVTGLCLTRASRSILSSGNS